MEISDTATEKKDSICENTNKNKSPMVICLDSESEHQVRQPQCNMNLLQSQVNNQAKNIEITKRKRLKKKKKHKKVQRQVHEIIDIENFTENRKSDRLSKKTLRNYQQPRVRRIKRTKAASQRKKSIQQPSNTLIPSISTADMARTSECPAKDSTNKRVQMNQVEEDNQNPFKRIFSVYKNQNKNCQADKNQEVQKETIETANLEELPMQLVQQNFETKARGHIGSQKSSKPNKINSQEEPGLPSQKFYKDFLQKNIVTNRRDAKYNSVLKYFGAKPSKYLETFMQNQVKKQEQKNIGSQAVMISQNKQKSMHVDVRIGQSKQNGKEKQNQIILIDQSEDEKDKDKMDAQILKSNGIKQSLIPQPLFSGIFRQKWFMQVDYPNIRNQNLQIYQNPERKMDAYQQSQNSMQEQDDCVFQPTSNQQISIQPEQPQKQQDIGLSPAQKLIKSKLKKIVTKKTVFYSSVSEITRNLQHENKDFLTFEQEHHFYSDQQAKSKCNLFSDEPRSIVKIKKSDNPQIYPNTCYVLYKSQSISNFANSQPYEVQLDKVRLLYPQKLLEFYEMASITQPKKIASIDQAQTVYDLSERAQNRIKHLYR